MTNTNDEQVTPNKGLEWRDDYIKRIYKAVNYRGNEDHDDVASILVELKEKFNKVHQEKLANQKKEMIERIREKKQSHFTEWQTLGDYKDGYLDAVDNILDDIIQTIKKWDLEQQ